MITHDGNGPMNRNKQPSQALATAAGPICNPLSIPLSQGPDNLDQYDRECGDYAKGFHRRRCGDIGHDGQERDDNKDLRIKNGAMSDRLLSTGAANRWIKHAAQQFLPKRNATLLTVGTQEHRSTSHDPSEET